MKNLHVPTRLTNIAGLPTAHSQRALDMRIKTWDLLRRQRKVVFLTATPIMNTIGEAYVMQLYLQQAQLEAAGIHHFDEWVSLYAQPTMAFEMKPDGSGFRYTTRLATFVNLPEMSAMWRQVLNLRTKAQMGLPEPELVTGKVIPVVVPPSATLKRYVRSLAARAEDVRNGRVAPTIDNMLKVVADGRKAALDIRLVVPRAPRPRWSKIAALVANVAELYHTYTPLRGTQLIFCDLATPKGSGRGADDPPTRLTAADREGEGAEAAGEVETAEERWLSNFVYFEIRDGLINQGIPRDEIAFIHDCATKAQRDALFAAMNEGRVRVLLGSTAKMSVGMNVQQRLIALHNLDCPWRPGDLEQRHGRILRQGNMWPSCYIFTYLTEGSFDAFMFQGVERKARFIEQALAGEITARTVEDVSDVVLSAAEIKAIASGNPQIVRKVQLEAEVARLERVRAVWLDTRRNLQSERRFTEDEIRRVERRCAQWAQAEALVAEHPREPFSAQVARGIGSEAFDACTVRAEAGAAVRRLMHEYQSAAAFQRRHLRGVVARYQGLDIVVQAHAVFAAELSLTLPDGTPLDGISARTDAGIWQSVGHTVSETPAILERLHERIAVSQERVITIDRELVRLEQWDGQATYDAAVSELTVINAAFAAAEEASAQPAQASASGQETSTPKSTTSSDAELAEQLLALAHEDGAEDGWGVPLPVIPPATASLALMAAAAEQEVYCTPSCVSSCFTESSPVQQGSQPAQSQAGSLPRAGKHRPQRPVSAPAEEMQQLSLF